MQQEHTELPLLLRQHQLLPLTQSGHDSHLYTCVGKVHHVIFMFVASDHRSYAAHGPIIIIVIILGTVALQGCAQSYTIR